MSSPLTSEFSRTAIRDRLEFVDNVGLFEELFCHQLTGNLEAARLEALGAVYNNAVEEEVGKLLGGENTCHREIPPSLRGLGLLVPTPRHYTPARRIARGSTQISTWRNPENLV